jgi:hypothetical protein
MFCGSEPAGSFRHISPYGMRVAERLKKAIEVDPTRAVVDYNKILREEQNEEERARASGGLGLGPYPISGFRVGSWGLFVLVLLS